MEGWIMPLLVTLLAIAFILRVIASYISSKARHEEMLESLDKAKKDLAKIKEEI